MNPKLIKFFHAATPSAQLVADPQALQLSALKRGFIIHPDILNETVRAFVDAETIDPNATFYRTWEDVVSKDRFTLFWDQILHYASTYGTEFSGPAYVPNEGAEAPDFTKYTVISPISEEDLFLRCRRLLYAGAALKSDTVALLCEECVAAVRAGRGEIDLDAVKNREALAVLSLALDRRPSDPVNLLRYIVYAATRETLLIRSDALLGKIKLRADNFDFNTLSQKDLERLASIFYRFKPLFLAFRGPKNRTVINRIRRMAPRFHRPLVPGFWESLLSVRPPVETVEARLGEISDFKLAALLQTVRERLLSAEETDPKSLYLVRNGKVFIAPSKIRPDAAAVSYWKTLAERLEARLIANLSAKACNVRFPEELRLTCPTSEKNFIGNLPFGAHYPMKGHNFFGIYWRNAWGTHDFDLSFVDWQGLKTGWNEAYNTGATVYSGDMTDADPEAAEVMYCKDTCPDGTIYCNRYHGEDGSRFRFYFGQEEIVELTRSYMVSPDAMAVNEEVVSDSKQKMLGIICGGNIYLMDLGVGNRRVSDDVGAGEKEKIFLRKSRAFLDLKDILLRAGFIESEAPELDLTKLEKDSLLRLFSPQ